MKAWRFHSFGDIRNLVLEEVPKPAPGPGEALVRVAYAALNPADRFLVMGKYPGSGVPPFSVGRDGSGVIESIPEGSRLRPGDRVLVLRSEIGVKRDGTLAQWVSIPVESLARIPEGWSMAEAAAGPLTLLTAWQALVDEGGLKPGDAVLVTGASGGVGTAAVVLARALGARVAALSRSPAKRSRLTELGADWTFDPCDEKLVDHVREALGGGYVNVVVETLAGPFLQKSIRMTGPRGRICVVGMLAGVNSEISIGSFMFKRIHIIGIAVGNYTAQQAQTAWARIVEILNRAGRRPLVDSVFPLEGVQEAFETLTAGPMGKILVGPMHPDLA